MNPNTIRSSGGRAHPGFSLIELLVVIAIIAILVALLLPSLGAVRARGRALACSSGMRQIAIGWQIYADQHDDISVPGQPGRFDDPDRNIYPLGNGEHYRPRWYAVISAAAGFDAYSTPSTDRADEHSTPVDGSGVFSCPEVPDWLSSRNYAYGYNYQFLGNTRFLRDDEQAGFINFPVRASTINNSTTVMFADSLGSAAGKTESVRTPNRTDGSRDPTLRAMGGHGYALDPPRLVSSSDFCDRRNRSFEHRGGPHDRHLGRANVAFADGHVGSESASSLGYALGEGGRILADGPEATNARFSGSMLDVLAPTVFGP